MSDSTQIIPVHTTPSYRVHIGGGLLHRCGAILRETLAPCRMAVRRCI